MLRDKSVKTSKSSPLVFVSHTHSEANLAIKLTNELRDGFLDGVQFFVSSDGQSIEVGDDWLQEIRQALNDACIVLVIVSPDSVNRTWVNFEAGAGWLGKRVIPICHPGISPNHLPQPLASLQGVDICQPDHLRHLFTVVGKAANLRSPDKDWSLLSDDLQRVCDLKTGVPNGASQCWFFPYSEDSRSRDALMQALGRCREARLCGTGLNFLWHVTTFQTLEQRLRDGELTVKICMGNRESPHIIERVAHEPEHHVGLDAWSGLIKRLVKLRGELSNPNQLKVNLFDHYPTYAILIFDDEYFLYTYPYKALGNVSPCFYWRGDTKLSQFYSAQFDRIFADSSPAYESFDECAT